MKQHGRLTELLEGRSAWGWLGGYVVVSWGILQVTETVASLVGLPLWFGKAVVTLLGLGLLVVLATALGHSGAAAAGGGSAGIRRLRRVFTWRRTALAGLLGFAFLGLGAAGHLGARALGVGPVGTLFARGLLTPEAELVLADFEDHTGEDGIARAATQAFRVHLSQSPSVRLASAARIADVLTRMEAEPDGTLDLGTAREVAIREGLRAVLGGEIHRVGGRYTLLARLVAAGSGEELVAALETADEPDDVIPAVERLSVRIRERIGESLISVRRSPPLGRVRTASLAALKSYTEGADANSRGDFDRCVLLMNEAIALDSTFAMAYVGRAACNQNLGQNRALQVTDRVRAYRSMDRMTDEERLRFTAIYHQFVTRDRRRAIEAWEAYSTRYPESASALFALANLYAEGRDWARGEATLLRGLAIDPASVVVLINLAGYRINQGRFAEAEEAFRQLESRAPRIDLGWRRATHRLAAADWNAAAAELVAARERARGNPGQRAIIATLQALLAQTLGRLEEAERLLREAMAAHLETGATESYHLTALTLADLHLAATADTAAALRVIDQALATRPLEPLDPFERSYLDFAEAVARAGRTQRARTLVAEWERHVATRVPGSTVPHHTRAVLAAAEGRWEESIAHWRLEDESREDPLPALVHIAHAFDTLGRPDSATAYYQRYLRTPSRLRYETDPAWRGRALARLAALHDERGEPVESARYHAMLVELWSGADPALEPRVAASRSRLESLTAER